MDINNVSKELLDKLNENYDYGNMTIEPSQEIDSQTMSPAYVDVTIRMIQK